MKVKLPTKTLLHYSCANSATIALTLKYLIIDARYGWSSFWTKQGQLPTSPSPSPSDLRPSGPLLFAVLTLNKVEPSQFHQPSHSHQFIPTFTFKIEKALKVAQIWDKMCWSIYFDLWNSLWIMHYILFFQKIQGQMRHEIMILPVLFARTY